MHFRCKESLSLSNDRTDDDQNIRSQCAQCVANGLQRVPFGKQCHQASTQDSFADNTSSLEKTTETVRNWNLYRQQ